MDDAKGWRMERTDHGDSGRRLARWLRQDYEGGAAKPEIKGPIMTNIVNLRQARKSRARVDKAKTAEENRARFGRTKAQRLADAAEQQKRDALLNGARLDRSEDK